MHGKSPWACEPGSQQPYHLKAHRKSHCGSRFLNLTTCGIFTSAVLHLTSKNTYFTAARDNFVAARDHLTAARDHLASARNHLAAAREHLAVAREHLAVAREHLAVARDQIAAARDHLAVARDHLAVARDHLAVATWQKTYKSHSRQATDKWGSQRPLGFFSMYASKSVKPILNFFVEF